MTTDIINYSELYTIQEIRDAINLLTNLIGINEMHPTHEIMFLQDVINYKRSVRI